jgi:nucleoside-diphosphate-sugar epimerase
VGSHSVRALRAAGHDVRLLVREPAKARRVFDPHGLGLGDLVAGDMTDEAAVGAALAGCDGVVHAAALVDLHRRAAARVLETNIRGVRLVVGGAARRGLPAIVYVSSLAIFFAPGGAPVTPELPIAPGTTAYARSKAQAELYVRRLQEEGAPIRISYPCGILGPDDPGLSDANHALRNFFRELGFEIPSGFQVVDVRDVAALHLRLLELPPGPHRYPAAGEMLRWKEVYDLIERLTGRRLHRIRLRLPGALVRVAGALGDAVKRGFDFDFPLTRDAMEFATRWPGADASRTTRELGIAFRPAEESYRDTLRWMHRAGHLGAEQVGRLA